MYEGIILCTCEEMFMGITRFKEFRVKMCQFSTYFSSPLKIYHEFFVGAGVDEK